MDFDAKLSPQHWRLQDILLYRNNKSKRDTAENILHSILTSNDILTWNTTLHQTGPTASTGEEQRPVTTITNFDQTVCTASMEEEERPVTTITNFDQTVCTASAEEETIDRQIQEVYQSKDTIFNIEDILDEIYDFFYYISKVTLIK